MTVNRPEPDHDTLLKLYGKAMLRIPQLAHATHQLRRHGNGRVLEDTPELKEQGLQDLVVKMDAPRALIFESNGGLRPAVAGNSFGGRLSALAREGRDSRHTRI